MKSILILTAGFGEGHNAAARNLAAALREADGSARVEVVDVFDRAYGWLNRLSQRGYLVVINQFPRVWEWVFRWLDRSSAVSERIGIFGRAVKELRRVVAEVKPDVVVTTYPGYNHLLDFVHRGVGARAFRQVTVVTDSITINSVWHTGHSDFFAVPNEVTAEVMRQAGVAPERLRVTGFPVPMAFADGRLEKSVPDADARWRVLFMINSGKRIAPETVRGIMGLDGVALTVTVGRDDALERRVRAVVREEGGSVEIFGWTDQMTRLMAEAHVVVSKAGGATVQECLAGVSPMVVSQVVPGQEEGNARLIVESGAGMIAETPEAIVAALREAFAEDGAKWIGWRNATAQLSRPEASREAAEWILKLAAGE